MTKRLLLSVLMVVMLMFLVAPVAAEESSPSIIVVNANNAAAETILRTDEEPTVNTSKDNITTLVQGIDSDGNVIVVNTSVNNSFNNTRTVTAFKTISAVGGAVWLTGTIAAYPVSNTIYNSAYATCRALSKNWATGIFSSQAAKDAAYAAMKAAQAAVETAAEACTLQGVVATSAGIFATVVLVGSVVWVVHFVATTDPTNLEGIEQCDNCGFWGLGYT